MTYRIYTQVAGKPAIAGDRIESCLETTKNKAWEIAKAYSHMHLYTGYSISVQNESENANERGMVFEIVVTQ